MSTKSVKGAAIVTGAAQGIGKAIALRLAKDGYDVALNDVPGKEDSLRTLADEIASHGRKSTIIIADVTNEKSVVKMIKETVSELGILRVMVANAGIALTIGTEFIDTRLEDFEKVLKVNLIGASSINGKRGKHISQYIQNALFMDSQLRFVRQATRPRAKLTPCHTAAEMIKHGITVNAYAPGYIDTPMGKLSSNHLQPITNAPYS
ncbi:hypothetical protein Clacol_004247 [Clathrus columnatus]|uniref:NAD(P)-binding protein n=1 Tax=Clathrus columnatus TaxID=1419009 RepID=A0AAV5A5V0_9AGAM|nr:hypothetical protein Clacol_004247 [Clathrus columnatus]